MGEQGVTYLIRRATLAGKELAIDPDKTVGEPHVDADTAATELFDSPGRGEVQIERIWFEREDGSYQDIVDEPYIETIAAALRVGRPVAIQFLGAIEGTFFLVCQQQEL